MDIQERKFRTVSHCVDLDNDSGKKVLVSVSICHISKCDGCDPSGEKGLHKPSCAWNILTNESCQVHEVKSRASCPVHDAIFPKDYVPPAGDRRDEEMTPDEIISCTDEDGKYIGVTKNEVELTNDQVDNTESPQQTDNVESEVKGEEIEKSEEIVDETEETNEELKEETQEETTEETNEEKQEEPAEPPKDEPPEPPQDGGGEFIPPEDMITADIPLLDASSGPYNVEDVLSVKADEPKYMSEASNLTYGEMKTQNETNACSYVFIDRLDENLSTRLPTIITEALASSALNLKEDKFQIPDCFYEPYRKITALTLDKIQQLKNKIISSNDMKAQASTEVYKIRDGDAICIVGQVEEPVAEESSVLTPEKMVTIENPEHGKKDEVIEFINKCPVCEMREKELKMKKIKDSGYGEEYVAPEPSMDKKDMGMAYDCSYINIANHPNASINVQVQKIQIGEGEEIVHLGKSYNILNSPLTEIITTKKILNSLNVSKGAGVPVQPSFPPYQLCSNQETLYIEPPLNTDMRSQTSKIIDIKALSTTNINDILMLQDTLKNKLEIKIDSKKDTKDVALETDDTENKCTCLKNKFHPCDHCTNADLVNQMIQTEESLQKAENEEEEEEDEVLKSIENQSELYKKEQEPKNGEENYKALSDFLEKVKRNAAEMSTVIKNQEKQFESNNFSVVRRKRRNQNEMKRGDYGISLQEWEFTEFRSKSRTQKHFDYGSKLVLSPEIPSVHEYEREFQILETLKEEDEDVIREVIPSKEKFRTLSKPSLLINLYKDTVRNSSFLKSLIPPLSSNGLFSDAVESHLHEQKRSLIPWLISLFIPTCECMGTNKGKKKPIETP